MKSVDGLICTEPGYFSFSAKNCSGRGACDGQRCVCDPGFSGSTHWVNADGEDCFVSLIAVRCLWAVVLAAFLISTLTSFPGYVQILRSFRRLQDKRIESGKKPMSILNDRTLFYLTFLFFVMYPFVMALSIWLLVDPEARIGGQIGPTLLWWSARSSLYVCTSLFQTSLIRKLALNVQESATLPFELSSRKLITAHFILGALVFVPLATDRKEAEVISWVIFNLGTAATLGVICYSGLYVRNTLLRQLGEAFSVLNDSEIYKTMDRISVMQKVVIREAFIQGLVHLLFGSIPWLFTTFIYWLPISWLAVSRVANTGIKLLRKEQNFRDQGREHPNLPLPEIGLSTNFKSETELTVGTVLEISRIDDHNLLETGSQFGRPSGRSTGRTTELFSGRPSGRPSGRTVGTGRQTARTTNTTIFESKEKEGGKRFGSIFNLASAVFGSSHKLRPAKSFVSTDCPHEEDKEENEEEKDNGY